MSPAALKLSEQLRAFGADKRITPISLRLLCSATQMSARTFAAARLQLFRSGSLKVSSRRGPNGRLMDAYRLKARPS